jgi:hypothetical protein
MVKKAVLPKKQAGLLQVIKKCLENGRYKFSKHALERKAERALELPDILCVLETGYHESAKDSWSQEYKTWNYAIRGETTDQNLARIIVSFDSSGLLIITVIRLNRKTFS